MEYRSNHVYLYMDEDTVIRYVGRGTVLRAQDHGDMDENPRFREAVRQARGNLAVMVCRYETPDEAAAVEASLIHVLKCFPAANLSNRRLDKYTFAPLGVPADLWARGTQSSLENSEIAEAVGGSFIAVFVGPKALTDEGRGVIDPLDVEVPAILDRVLGSWAFGASAEHWKADESARPSALVAVTGPPARRYVLASIDLREFDFGTIGTRNHKDELKSLISFETSGFETEPSTNTDLDAFNIRGRLVTGLNFDRAPQTRRWLDRSGVEHPQSPYKPRAVA
jgi:hypothetical protein